MNDYQVIIYTIRESDMGSNQSKIQEITIVGGGDAGLLTALALDKGLNRASVRVIDDSSSPQPNIGKSTLHYFAVFLHNYLEINPQRLLENVKLCLKTTVYFEDWCGKEFHSPLGLGHFDIEDKSQSNVIGGQSDDYHEEKFHEFYYRYRQNEFTTLYEIIGETPGMSPMTLDKNNFNSITPGLPSSSYQFQTRELNRFLRTICSERDVEIIDDYITEVKTANNKIEKLKSDSTEYTADLYVDATGFNRLLMRELENSFKSLDLPVDSAIVTDTDISLSEAQSATVVTTGTAGWFWQIDAWNVRDLGYVYSSDYLSKEKAATEFINTRKEDIDPDRFHYHHWEPGVLKRPWINNCVAIGNAMGFPEPLNSLGISTFVIVAERLAKLLARNGRFYSDYLQGIFNETALATFNDAYNIQSVFYKYNSGSDPFWKDARSINPGELAQFEAYQGSGFAPHKMIASLTRTEADTFLNPYILYYLIYRGLGVESKFYEDLDLDISESAAARVNQVTENLYSELDYYLSYEEIAKGYHPGFD